MTYGSGVFSVGNTWQHSEGFFNISIVVLQLFQPTVFKPNTNYHLTLAQIKTIKNHYMCLALVLLASSICFNCVRSQITNSLMSTNTPK